MTKKYRDNRVYIYQQRLEIKTQEKAKDNGFYLALNMGYGYLDDETAAAVANFIDKTTGFNLNGLGRIIQ